MDVVKAIEIESVSKIKDLIISEDENFFSTRYSYKALNKALEAKRKDVVKLLLADNRCMINRTDNTLDLTNTPLHNAVKWGDVDIIDTLLKRNASISAINVDGDSPLHLAFLRRYDGIVDKMLIHADKTLHFKNPKNNDGLTHFHIACTRKNTKVIIGFLKSKASFDDIINADSLSAWAGYTAMHFAVEFNSIEAVVLLSKFLINNDVSLSRKDNKGRTPLQLADDNLVNQMIINDNLKINDDPRKYLSYFHLACLTSDVNVVKKFIENGADVNGRVTWISYVLLDYFPLHCALESPIDRTEKVNLLLRYGAKVGRFSEDEDMTPLHLALYTEPYFTGNKTSPINVIYETLVTKEDNITDEYGLSIFHIAVAMNDINTVDYHLDNGVDINQVVLHNSRIYSNYTALHFAVRFGHLEMAEFLIRRGADVNANIGKSNDTPLFIAFEGMNYDFVELLLNHGARVDVVRQRDQETLLHVCVNSFVSCSPSCQAKILQYAEMLVYMGVDVNAVDRENFTALHHLWWAYECSAPCVKLLLDLGADVNIEANEIGTAFQALKGSKCSTIEDMIFVKHIRKLKALGLHVSLKNEKSYNILKETLNKRELDNIDKQLYDEILAMDNTKISSHLTLYEFIMLDSKRATAYIENGALKRIIEEVDEGQQFPVYGYFIKLKYREALRHIKILNL